MGMRNRTQRFMLFAVLAIAGPFAACDDAKGRHGHACTMNLYAIEGAKATWALKSRRTTNDVPTDSDLFGPDSYIREKPRCPEGGVYTLGKVGEKPKSSIRRHNY
jgi:hypothetical protein